MSVRAYIPNALSTLRILLIVPLIVLDPVWHLPILLAALASDFFDGYLARRWNVSSRAGAIIDPIGDKALMLALAYLYWGTSKLGLPELVVIFLRDIDIALFSLWLLATNRWTSWKIRSFWCGKIATTLQGAMFLCIMCGYTIPTYLMGAMIFIGLAAPFELYFLAKTHEALV